MSIHSSSARPETIIFLAWATRRGLQETMIDVHEKRKDAERVLRAQITYSQPPVFETDRNYGPLYEALFAYRLDRVEFQLVDWALRGYYGLYLKAYTDVEECAHTTPETDILWRSITTSDSLLFRVKRIGREWNSEVRKVANALRLHFTFQVPLIMRTPESSFLFQEFIGISLEQVNWSEIAALVLEVPYQPEMTLEGEDKEGDYEAMQLTLLKGLLWRAYSDFGEFCNHPLFAQPINELCLDLVDHCRQTHGEVCQLEESDSIYSEDE